MYMNYEIAIFPSKSIQDDANSYRTRYDPHYSLIPPHLTVLITLQAVENLLEVITTELHVIAKDTKPFTIYMNNVSSFAPVANTIYFKVEQIQPLLELYDRTHEGIFPIEEGHSFVPHITIAQGLTDDE